MSVHFHVGQKVVCVDVRGSMSLKEGAIYTIASIEQGLFRSEVFGLNSVNLILIEVEPEFPTSGFSPKRFRPAVERKTDIAIFTAMLKKTRISVPA